MAVDTANKRRAVQGGILPVADGAWDALDRAILQDLPALGTEPVVVPDFNRPASDWEMPYANYQCLFGWRITGWEREDADLNIKLEELKTQLETKLPIDIFERGDLDEATFTYPNISDDAEGESVPIAYGEIFKAPAYCIDTTTNTFRMAGAAISGFAAFYDDDNIFDPDSQDTSKAEFVYAAWDGQSEITCSFIAALDNPVDVIQDLLTTHVGFTTDQLLSPAALDATAGQGFGTYGARTKYIRGTDSRNNKEVSLARMGLWVGETETAQEIIETILLCCFGYLYQGRCGQWTFRAWQPVQVGNVDLVLGDGDVHGVSWRATAKDRFTKAICRYKHQIALDQYAAVSYVRDDLRRARNLGVHNITNLAMPFVAKEDATWWCQRRVAMRGKVGRILEAEVSQRALGLSPGDTIHLTYTYRNIDGVYLVLGVEEVPGSGKVNLTLTEWHGFGTRPGWWAPDDPTFPADLGGGAITGWDITWTDAQKLWYQRTYGVWLDDNGIADGDEDSFERSVWI